MEGRLVPDGYLAGMPLWQAAFESRPAVQLHHRWFAYLLTAAGLVLSWRYWRRGGESVRRFAIAIPAALLFQVMLGIATLMSAAPLWLSLFHQGGAIVLFGVAGMAAYTLSRAEGATAPRPARSPHAATSPG